MTKKKKSKWTKGVGPRDSTPRDEDILDDGDFVMDGYTITPTRQKSFDLDDINLDYDDYEYKQEEINGLESEDAEPIAVDRYFRRIR
jgi:hypothetical protein